MKLIFFVLLMSRAALAAPDCDYTFNISNAVIILTENQQVIEQDMTVLRGKNSSDPNCINFRIFFNKGLANSYQRKAFNSEKESVNYNLHRQSNLNGVLKDFNDAVSFFEYVEGLAPLKNVVYKNNFHISVPSLNAQNSPSAGSYSDNIQASVYSLHAVTGKYEFQETRSFTVTYLVAKKIELSLISEGGRFDPRMTYKLLDFGYIEQNEEQGVDLRVVSNTAYQLKISSLNNGQLKHGSTGLIPYSLKVNGAQIALSQSGSSPVNIGSGAGRTSSAGDLFNLKIKITGSPNGKPPGLYQDMMTITAIAN